MSEYKDAYHEAAHATVSVRLGLPLDIGIGNSTEKPAVKKWLSERVAQAADALLSDEGDGWERVAYALHKKKRLSGDEVRELLGLELQEAGEEGT